VPLYSTVRGEALEGGELDGGYWYANLRQPIRFGEAVRQLVGDGFRHFVEVSPHPVLTVAVETTVEEAGCRAEVVGTLRRDEDSERCLGLSLGGLYAGGLEVDGASAVRDGRRVMLPSYAFDRQRYWLKSGPDVGRGGGLRATEHPLLGGGYESAGAKTQVFVTELSRRSPRWLKDHAVFGEVVVSGTTILELCRAALAAARPNHGNDDDGWDVADLVLTAPLILPERGRVEVQVEVSASDAGGPEVEVYSRLADSEDGSWTLHATASSEWAEPEKNLGAAPIWPEDGVELWDQGAYERLAASGMVYGPSFRGTRSVVRVGPNTVLARVSLGDELGGGREGEGYGIHPALWDAALHPVGVLLAERAGGPGPALLPFGFERLTVWRPDARALVVRLERIESIADGAGFEVDLWDERGRAVGRLSGVELRPASAASVRGASEASRDLYEVSWQPVSAGRALESGLWAVVAEAQDQAGATLVEKLAGAGVEVARWSPDQALPAGLSTVVRLWPDQGQGDAPVTDVPGAAHGVAARGLAELQASLAAESPPGSTVWVTRGAVACARDEAVPSLWQSSLWGLLRSARAEEPDRGFRLIDLGSGPSHIELLMTALAVADEPELAVRGGELFAPRLVRRAPTADGGSERAVPDDGTVLVTGGLGALGLEAARWLVERGARRLVLTSRRGLDGADSGAAERVAELVGLGAEVEVAACDVADRDALARILAAIPAEAPLRGVVHCAGILDDGVVGEQTVERLARVMAAKVWGGWHLHELTRTSPLEFFVLYSSAAGVIGAPGQSTYAAANVFLDELAHARRAQGLLAQSLSWGAWRGGGLASERADLDRMERQGFGVITPARGALLLESALGDRAVHLVPWPLAPRRLSKTLGGGGAVPALWRALVRPARVERGGSATGVKAELERLPPDERRERLLALVQAEAAQVLGLRSPIDVGIDQPLQTLGLDSLMALALRNRLGERLGLRPPAALVFDYPTVRRMSEWASERLFPNGTEKTTTEQQLIAAVSRAVAVTSVGRLKKLGVLNALCELAGIPDPHANEKGAAQRDEELDHFADFLDELDDHGLSRVLDETIEGMSSN
jgi:acyl transferase domain-containing protein/acyl carrier protein